MPVCSSLPLYGSTPSNHPTQTAMKVARERKSSVLASNAVHHRVDSLTGIVTLFAILGANFFKTPPGSTPSEVY